MKYFLPVLIVFLSFCTERERKEESSAYFKTEIGSRMAAIKDLKLADSVKVDVMEVDKEVDRLLLMSKDIENVQASINLSKKFFDELAAKNNINRSDFTDITHEMTLEEIENALKGNELNFFNQILFRYKASPGMYTAQ
jgi:hypothetical protein